LLLGPLESSLRLESAPELFEALAWSTHESASAPTVCVVQSGATTVQVCVAGVGSTLPARSTARTSKLYGAPALRPL
jgi:hypothetical protein